MLGCGLRAARSMAACSTVECLEVGSTRTRKLTQRYGDEHVRHACMCVYVVCVLSDRPTVV